MALKDTFKQNLQASFSKQFETKTREGIIDAVYSAAKIDTITEMTGNAGVTIEGVLLKDNDVTTDGVFPRVTSFIAASGTTVVTNGCGRNFTTSITLATTTIGIAGAAAEGNGVLIGTFPAGVHTHSITYMDVTLQGTGTVDTDTPDVGIGSVIATGAVATLDGTPTFEDYITGQTATDCNGTATVAQLGATAGLMTGISLNAVGDVKALYLNVADTWAGADTITATGTVTLQWTVMD